MQGKYVRNILAGALLPLAAHAATPDVMAVSAPNATPTDAEAQAAFEAAQKAFQNTRTSKDDDGRPTPLNTHNQTIGAKPEKLVGVPEVMVFSDPTREITSGTSDPKNIPLESIRVVVDVENDSLRDVLHKVITQAGRYTGPWQVKWRLKPENVGLMDEHVNLTAEAPFGDFIDLLADRVKNLTGVQLFITSFNESRIIMVADTYY